LRPQQRRQPPEIGGGLDEWFEFVDKVDRTEVGGLIHQQAEAGTPARSIAGPHCVARKQPRRRISRDLMNMMLSAIFAAQAIQGTSTKLSPP
jgi:hypothetical protein